jgi:hypothetical protein
MNCSLPWKKTNRKVKQKEGKQRELWKCFSSLFWIQWTSSTWNWVQDFWESRSSLIHFNLNDIFSDRIVLYECRPTAYHKFICAYSSFREKAGQFSTLHLPVDPVRLQQVPGGNLSQWPELPSASEITLCLGKCSQHDSAFPLGKPRWAFIPVFLGDFCSDLLRTSSLIQVLSSICWTQGQHRLLFTPLNPLLPNDLI